METPHTLHTTFLGTCRGDLRTRVPDTRVEATIGTRVARGGFCKYRSARQNCHTLSLLHLESDRVPTTSMPAAGRPHCILRVRIRPYDGTTSLRPISRPPPTRQHVRRSFATEGTCPCVLSLLFLIVALDKCFPTNNEQGLKGIVSQQFCETLKSVKSVTCNSWYHAVAISYGP